MLVFNNPWYLLLLAVLPAMWWFSFGGLSGLGRWRRLFALGLRSLVVMLLVAALAEMQFQRTSDKLTVIYLLDQSLSIPEARRDAMIDYVNASIRDQREAEKGDRAGVIVFGKNAEVEVPPVDLRFSLGIGWRACWIGSSAISRTPCSGPCRCFRTTRLNGSYW